MALTLIKEDGTGKADANSYASVADCDAYHEAHLYATAWTAATADKKAAALVFATRLIDALFQFNGFRANSGQALQWPRQRCPDPDAGPAVSVGSAVVPSGVVNATCEMARELIVEDRTAPSPGEGIATIRTEHHDAATTGGAGAVNVSETEYDKGDTRPVISKVAQAMLAKYGTAAMSRGGIVKLERT